MSKRTDKFYKKAKYLIKKTSHNIVTVIVSLVEILSFLF